MIDIVTKLVESGKTLFTYLTVKNLAVLFGLGVLVLTFRFGWDHGNDFYTTMKAAKFSSDDFVLESITLESQEFLKKTIDNDENLITVNVVSTDFRRQVRTSVFFYSKRREVQRDFEFYFNNKSAPTPIFGVNDIELNTRIIGIINQQFVCVPLSASLQKNIPSAARNAAQVCSLSVPPRYGDMVGYITLWMREPISDENQEYYHNLARNLSNNIYKRDIRQRMPKVYD